MTDLQPVVATYIYKKEAVKAELAAILQDFVTVYGSITTLNAWRVETYQGQVFVDPASLGNIQSHLWSYDNVV